MFRVSLLITLCLHACFADYLITVPQKWATGFNSQICLTTPNGLTADDSILFSLFGTDDVNSRPSRPSIWRAPPPPSEDEEVVKPVLVAEKKLDFPLGETSSCVDIIVPETSFQFGDLKLTGTVQGSALNESRFISFIRNGKHTFIQTDKYLYKAGQNVQFRILSIDGPFFKVSTTTYSEIYIESPSGSRIAQWLNVTNTGGLIHREFQLIEEPEEGTYTISVRREPGEPISKVNFKIEDYVLPRFEVKISKPKYILGTDEVVTFKVCANYTFGQPMRGKLTGTLDNNNYGKNKIQIPIDEEIFGCKDVVTKSEQLQMNKKSSFVHRISLDVKVEEEGTGNIGEARESLSVTRHALTFLDKKIFEFRKPELPYMLLAHVSLPDGSPLANEPFKACISNGCINITSDAEGYVRCSIPPHIKVKNRYAKIHALNFPDLELPGEGYTYSRRYMHASTLTVYPSDYFSPSNSSLQLLPESTTSVVCNPGGPIDLKIGLLYSAHEMTEATLNIQMISRGQIQYSGVRQITFVPTELPSDFNLISPMAEPFNKSTVRGMTDILVSIPPSMSPKVKVLVWYTRTDGEVVPDSREFEITKCLPHQVSMSWPKKRVEQGTTLPLTLKAQPNSICSMGIVDKSVELLASGNNKLTLQNMFDPLSEFDRNSYRIRQIDNYSYCKKKREEEEAKANSTTTTTLSPPTEAPTKKKRSIAPWPPRHNHYSDFVDAIKMFDKAGVYIISDLEYETRPCELNEPVMVAFSGGALPGAPGAPPPQNRPRPRPGPAIAFQPEIQNFGSAQPAIQNKVGIGAATAPEETDITRTYFPETWLWDIYPIPANGVYTEDLTLPDTITEWVGKAVCVHPDMGVGLSGTTSITTFTPFFVDITMLPNIKKGEIMPIVISVFNYLDTSLPVRVTVTPSAEFEILVENGTVAAEDQTAAGTFTLCLPQGDKNTAELRLRPLAVGDVEMVISATVDDTITGCEHTGSLPVKTDTIIKPLTVELEGFPREKTWTKYICSEDILENQDHAAKWRLEAPQNIVPDSGRSWVTVVGDLMGPTLENLGGLIRMPYGCGEQNMLNFAPNIYVLQYLEASNQIDEPTRGKLERFMRKGYQRELNYKHSIGSYSAFGESDNSGSTWLTAFVVKSFAQARPYITVDSTELSMSSDWLKTTQLENGCFESRGKVLHKGMKGGISDSKPKLLTAYVMAALLEAGEDPASETITNAIFCLNGTDSETTKEDPYELSLIAYALALGKNPAAETTLQTLLKIATNSTGGIFWEMNSSSGKVESKTTAVAVETAGYVLMAMLETDADKYMQVSHQIIKWMSEQRNSQGGFISTQDTVVALQAMAHYESYQNSETLDMNVSFQGTDLNADFKVLESNKLLTQREDVVTLPNNVFIKTNGTGCVLAQGVVRYNVKDGEPSEAFSLSVSTSNHLTKCKAKKIKVCASYLLRDGKSNMAVIEVSLVSGYIPDKKDLKRIVGYGTGIIKRYEVDGRKVLFYIDEFTPTETCVEFSVIEEAIVSDPKPGTVKVYDYYEPEFEITENYKLARRYFCRNEEVIPFDILDDIIVDEPEPLVIEPVTIAAVEESLE